MLAPAGVLGNYTITYNTADFTITEGGVGDAERGDARPTARPTRR